MKFQIQNTRYNHDRQSPLSYKKHSNSRLHTTYSHAESSGERDMASLSIKRQLKPAYASSSIKVLKTLKKPQQESSEEYNRLPVEERKSETLDENPSLSYALKASNWYEVRFTGRCPERRAYHISFVIDKQ